MEEGRVPKIRLEDVKEIKVERKVFDEATLFAIYKLITRGVIRTVESLLKEGKESLILSALDGNDRWYALKVYRTYHCDFKSMWKYLIGDPRFSNIKKSRRSVILAWCRREFRNLKIAHEHGITCPKPVDFYENVLVMEFIGEEGEPAPRLIDVERILDKEVASKLYEMIMEDVEKLVNEAELVHTDLSPYNILVWDKPYIIDFSQAVPLEHPLAKDFLSKDVKNINRFFRKFGVEVREVKCDRLS